MGKELICIVNMPLVVIDPGLEIVPAFEIGSNFKKELLGGKKFCFYYPGTSTNRMALKFSHQCAQEKRQGDQAAISLFIPSRLSGISRATFIYE